MRIGTKVRYPQIDMSQRDRGVKPLTKYLPIEDEYLVMDANYPSNLRITHSEIDILNRFWYGTTRDKNKELTSFIYNLGSRFPVRNITTLYRGMSFPNGLIEKYLKKDVDKIVGGLRSWSTSLKVAKLYTSEDTDRDSVLIIWKNPSKNKMILDTEILKEYIKKNHINNKLWFSENEVVSEATKVQILDIQKTYLGEKVDIYSFMEEEPKPKYLYTIIIKG
jgi:hypothetical protein